MLSFRKFLLFNCSECGAVLTVVARDRCSQRSPFEFCISVRLEMNPRQALTTFWLLWNWEVDWLFGLVHHWTRPRLRFSQRNTWQECAVEACTEKNNKKNIVAYNNVKETLTSCSQHIPILSKNTLLYNIQRKIR